MTTQESPVQAEQVLLGAILSLGVETFKRIAASIEPDNLKDERNRRIFRAMAALESKGRRIELHAVIDELRSSGGLPTAGGADYVASLVFVCESADKIEESIRTVQRATGSSGRGARREAIVVCVGEVEPEEVSWLWHPYIPRRKLTLLEGDPGLGKSWISLAIATSISLGKGIPGADLDSPAPVLVCSAEDGIADTIRPRLDTMGADVTKIHALARSLVFDVFGLAEFEGEIRRIQPALVVVDPLVAYMGARVDIHRGNETRAILSQLADMAERHRIAILAIRHLRKSSADKAIYRGIGGIDFTAAARSVLLAGADPEDDKKRALIHIKSNLAPNGESLGYELRDGTFSWTGLSDLTAERVLSASRNTQDASSAEKAEAFLLEVLAEGPILVEDIKAKAVTAGFSWRTMERAKKSLGIESDREGFGPGSQVLWKLPDDHTPPIDRHTPPSGSLAAYGDFGGVWERSGNGRDHEGDTIDIQQAPCPNCGKRAWGHLGGLDYKCATCRPNEAARP